MYDTDEICFQKMLVFSIDLKYSETNSDVHAQRWKLARSRMAYIDLRLFIFLIDFANGVQLFRM